MKLRQLTCALGVAAVLAGGCAASDATSETSAAPAGAADNGSCTSGPGVTDTKIRLGVTTPLSGSVANLGRQHLTAQEAFVKWVNGQGGINGRKLELVSQDDGFDPQKAVTNAQYLIDQEKVFALWGNVGSAQASAVKTVTASTKTPLLFPLAQGRDLTDPVQPYTFTIATPNYDLTRALSDHLAEDPKFTGQPVGFVIISSPDGAENVDGFKAGASGKGVKSVQTYERGATTFKPQLLALKSAGVKVVYAAVNDVQYPKLLQEAGELGLLGTITFIGSTSTATDQPFKLAANAVEGQYTTLYSELPTSDAPGAVQMRKALAEHAPG
jgi:branched-chain amino acid transport system substrate-binding protein